MTQHAEPVPTEKKRVWRDTEIYLIQDDVELIVFWKVLPIGKGPALVLRIFGQDVLRFDCFGKDRGHFHTKTKLWATGDERRIFFRETTAADQVDRAIFELSKNLGYYLKINPDPDIRQISIKRASLETNLQLARARMLDFLSTVPELQDLRTVHADFTSVSGIRALLNRLLTRVHRFTRLGSPQNR
ncbi:MAG: hypothetical protein AAF299_00760 [Pseudomonadota bacterium]